MSDDLVKRLRERAGKYDEYDWHGDIELEAADRIEKLEAVTKDELLHCFHRINELQTALRMVIDWDNTLDWDDGPAWGDLMDIARKALEGKDD